MQDPVSRKRFLTNAAFVAAPAILPAPALAAIASAQHNEAPGVTHRSWTPPLEDYDSEKYGPLLAVSDEGENAPAIAAAAYASAKARALHHPDATSVGIMIDGERMVSAGEGPIGPDEYAKVYAAARDKTYCSTNVGVRANTRVYLLQPEFAVANAAANENAWLAGVFAAFAPFIHTPNGVPRPLTARLIVAPTDSAATVTQLVAKLEAGRASGKLGPATLHTFALLSIADGHITAGAPVNEIERVFAIAAQATSPKSPSTAISPPGRANISALHRCSTSSTSPRCKRSSPPRAATTCASSIATRSTSTPPRAPSGPVSTLRAVTVSAPVNTASRHSP